MRGRAAERALGVGVARLPEIEVAQRQIRLCPRGLEPQRAIEASFRAVQIAFAREQNADVVMGFGQCGRALECAAIIGQRVVDSAGRRVACGARQQVAQRGHARNMKYTAPTMQIAAQRKSSFSGWSMDRSANGKKTASVMTSCM